MLLRSLFSLALAALAAGCSSSIQTAADAGDAPDAAAPTDEAGTNAPDAGDAAPDTPTGPLGTTDGTVAQGWYCGSDAALFSHLVTFQEKSLENPNNLFVVDAKSTVSIVGYCTSGCVAGAGGKDHCEGPPGYPARGTECFNGPGAYCGHTLGIEARSFPIGNDKEGLFDCDENGGVTLTTNCDCEVNPGDADACSTTGPGGSRKLYVATETSGSCPSTLTDFFECLFGHTDLNAFAVDYTTGYPLRWGAVKSAPASCGADWQCVEDAAQFPLRPYDVLLVVTGSTVGGENFWDTTVTVSSKTIPIHSAKIGDGGGSCAMQTAYGMHEVYEAISDPGAADCCDGEVPYTPAGESGCLAWNSADAPACGQWGPTSCGGNGSYGLATLDCGGTSYTYQRVSPATDEFGQKDASDCRTLTYTP